MQAEGALKGGQAYNGGLPTPNDRDWYVFYVAGQQQLDIPVENLSGNDRLIAYLRDADGTAISEERIYEGEADRFRYTTPPGTNRFYLEIRDGSSTSYRLRVDPAAALVDGPTWGQAEGTPEPNESAAQAFGPLSGGVLYAGALQTANDEDWFAFHALGQRALDVSLVGTGREGQEVEIRMHDSRNLDSDSTGAAESRIAHIRRRSPSGITRYLIQITGDLDASYQLRIDPADALTQKPIEPCYDARRKVKRLRQKLASIDRALKKRMSKKRRAELRRKRKRVARQLAAALQEAASACGP